MSSTGKTKVPQAIVKVVLDDNIILKQLGLAKTYKAVEISKETTTTDMEESIRERILKGLSPEAVQILEPQLPEYKIFLVATDAKETLLQETENPWVLTKVYDQVCFKPVGTPHFKSPVPNLPHTGQDSPSKNSPRREKAEKSRFVSGGRSPRSQRSRSPMSRILPSLSPRGRSET